MSVTTFEILGTALFALAIMHTFLAPQFCKFAEKFPDGSIAENVFHLLGEVEVVFGLWAGMFFIIAIGLLGYSEAVHYVEKLNFTEPVFVFVIMAMAATQPVLTFSRKLMFLFARGLPLAPLPSFYFVTLLLGPLLGSLITEPAAMTVVALLLKEQIFDKKISSSLRYATLGLLFVNISIGGTLTHYAAPSVLMVASTWNWDTAYMLTHFGYKAFVAILISTSLFLFWFRKELGTLKLEVENKPVEIPAWLTLSHFLFLAFVVFNAHHTIIFMGVFLFFIGVVQVTKEYQSELKLKEALLVGFFLGGLVVLGGVQKWWLEPILNSIGEFPLFVSAIGLTALLDNAALTYLGSQVPTISESSKYALVAGAVTGGGLTVIANAPNPAGYGILQSSFTGGISPLGLLKGAAIPTLVSLLCYWFLPHL